MTIPQYGTITCEPENRPMVFLTSNNYRELSDALKRRCNYLYIPEKSKDEIIRILEVSAGVDEKIAAGVANAYERIKNLRLKQKPSIAELSTWAKYLQENPDVDVQDTLYMVAKNKHDHDAILALGRTI